MGCRLIFHNLDETFINRPSRIPESNTKYGLSIRPTQLEKLEGESVYDGGLYVPPMNEYQEQYLNIHV